MSDLQTARVIALNLLRGQDLPDEAGVRRTAEIAVQALMMQIPAADVDVDSLTRELEANLNVAVGMASTLTDETSDHLPWLAAKRASIEWGFARRYQRFLEEQKGWARATLQRSNNLTDRIIELLEDPKRPGVWDRRGMVVGEVQSGKTSNYIELVCKAADAGYKFIVVLTGTTNSLRAQTQLRFDEGFLGWDTRLNLALDSSNKRVGVGTLLGEQLYRVIPSTNAEERGDFNLRIANQFNVRLGGDPVIMVVKKNASVLRNLTRWARSLSTLGPDDAIPDIPTLLIDDEADFASVNTRPTAIGDDDDPTVINRRIRELLSAFEKRVYIGYTATPFANIFIYPEQEMARYGRDLFPRDFLINLPVPSNHVGPTKVFGLPEDPDDESASATPMPLVRPVVDNEAHIPSVHRSGWTVDELPDSLTRAIRAFVLACAVRAARRQEEQHNSMLIHVTRFVNIQSRVADLVGAELRDIQNRIRYGDGDSTGPILEELRSMWLEDFVPTSRAVKELYPDLTVGCGDVPWDVIRQRLIEASQKIQVKVINGSVRDALDYWDHPDGLSAIVIGGDKLSRGLTLEGLSVRGCLISWGPGQAAQHDPGHGSVDPSFRSFRQTLIILAQTPLQIQPAEGAFHHPTPGQYLESMLLPGPAHQLQIPATRFLGPLHQLAAVGPVGPNYLQPGILPQQTLQHQLGAVPVLYVGRMHRHCQQQPQGIDHYVALAPLHLLARIVTPWPPFSAVFTDWLSMIAALGLAWRPSD